jgi:glycosyltransferase involved in cell wall biosynthesis
MQPYAGWIEKIHPISIGLPLKRMDLLPKEPVAKTADIFFSGRIAQSSSIRPRGLAELLALKEQGVAVDISDRPLPPAEFYQRCAGAHLTWSPEGYGWDCFRHYEAPACRSVPVINTPTIERYSPLIAEEHVLFYSPEPGGLTRAVVAALADKPRLARMAEAGRNHVLAHHSPGAIARHVVETTLGLSAKV